MTGEGRGCGLSLKTGKGSSSVKRFHTLSWQVEELRHPTHHCTITLSFRRNRYLQNEVVVKEYLINVSGKRQLPGFGGWGQESGG